MRTIRVGIDTPRITYSIGNEGLTAKRRGILAAMLEAVRMSEPGDLILQEDVEIPEEQMPMVDVAARHALPGTIVCMNPPRTEDHTCPQAFIISNEATRQTLIAAWSRPTTQACLSWWSIPKRYPPVQGTHDGRPWR